jgi:hypothetical protein
MLSLRRKKSKTEPQAVEALDKVLANEEHRKLLKEFAVQSFCPESLRKLGICLLTTNSVLGRSSGLQQVNK